MKVLSIFLLALICLSYVTATKNYAQINAKAKAQGKYKSSLKDKAALKLK